MKQRSSKVDDNDGEDGKKLSQPASLAVRNNLNLSPQMGITSECRPSGGSLKFQGKVGTELPGLFQQDRPTDMLFQTLTLLSYFFSLIQGIPYCCLHFKSL